MQVDRDIDKKVLEHIFTVSPTMIGVCLGLITLLKVTNNSLVTYADEVLSFDALVFMCSIVASFISLKYFNKYRTSFIADLSFLLGMFILVVSGIIIVFIECHNNGTFNLNCHGRI